MSQSPLDSAHSADSSQAEDAQSAQDRHRKEEHSQNRPQFYAELRLIEEAGLLHIRLLGRPGLRNEKYWRVMRHAHIRYERRRARFLLDNTSQSLPPSSNGLRHNELFHVLSIKHAPSVPPTAPQR